VQYFYSVLEPGGYLFLGHSESISKMPVKFQAIVLNDCILYRKPTAEEVQKAETRDGGTCVSAADREAVEVFLQEASEHLQYLREYIGVLQEIAPRHEDLERLYISAHTLSGTSASYGFPRFSEIAGKLAHVFQYATNASLGEDLHGPLTEFLPLTVSRCWKPIYWKSATPGRKLSKTLLRLRNVIALRFRRSKRQSAMRALRSRSSNRPRSFAMSPRSTGSYFDALPEDDEVAAEILEFFQPEAEEHLQIVSDCLLSLEAITAPRKSTNFSALSTP